MIQQRTQPLVLLLDDEDIFLEVAAMNLEARGFVTALARNVDEAIHSAIDLQPDCALSDISLSSDSSGWDFALALKRNPKTSHIKFAFLTSLRDPWRDLKGDPGEASQILGDVVFFDKCYDIEHLADRVLTLLQ